MSEVAIDDEELIFKRFPEAKQDQVRALVNYATLMGLTGKDLISIGGTLDRIKEARERKRRIASVKGYTLLPIGTDSGKTKHDLDHIMRKRFKLETASGAYYFECRDYNWKITNPRTKKSIRYEAEHYDWGRSVSWEVRERNNILFDIHEGNVQLNF